MKIKRGRPLKSVSCERTWEIEIAELMDEFCMLQRQIDQVISATKKEITVKHTEEEKYRIAWRKFWAIYNAA